VFKPFFRFSHFCFSFFTKSFTVPKTDKDKKQVEYIATEKFYFNTVAQALERYMELKQVILPSIVEMLEVQKEVAEVLKEFKEKYKNWQ